MTADGIPNEVQILAFLDGRPVEISADEIDDAETGFVAYDVSGPHVSRCVEFYPLQLAEQDEATHVLIATGTSGAGPFEHNRSNALRVLDEPIDAMMAFRVDGAEVDAKVRQEYQRPCGDHNVLGSLDLKYNYAFQIMTALFHDAYLQRADIDHLLKEAIRAEDIYRPDM